MKNSPYGWVDVDKYTLQHNRYPDVFSLGDVSSTPNAKTGAAVRKQAPVMVANLLSLSIISNWTPTQNTMATVLVRW